MWPTIARIGIPIAGQVLGGLFGSGSGDRARKARRRGAQQWQDSGMNALPMMQTQYHAPSAHGAQDYGRSAQNIAARGIAMSQAPMLDQLQSQGMSPGALAAALTQMTQSGGGALAQAGVSGLGQGWTMQQNAQQMGQQSQLQNLQAMLNRGRAYLGHMGGIEELLLEQNQQAADRGAAIGKGWAAAMSPLDEWLEEQGKKPKKDKEKKEGT